MRAYPWETSPASRHAKITVHRSNERLIWICAARAPFHSLPQRFPPAVLAMVRAFNFDCTRVQQGRKHELGGRWLRRGGADTDAVMRPRVGQINGPQADC